MQYQLNWRNKLLTAEATTILEMADALQAAAGELRAMHAKGVVLEEDSDMVGDWAFLGTNDPAVAKEFGFDEAEQDEAEDFDSDKPAEEDVECRSA
jgi:hypothetical protein